MLGLSRILAPHDIKKISNLQVLARSVVEGFCAGLHRSPHKGFSVEFRQHRQYVHGDEIKRIDWKVFGRSDRYYIREYEEETNVRATILLDCSGSMNYGSGDITKHAYATRLAACLSYLMIQQTDGVGLVTFDTKVRNYVPPRTRPSHLRILLDTMEAAKPGGETSLGKVFHDVSEKIHRRGLLIVLSDCFGDVPELMRALAQLRFAHHEIIVFQIWDRAELDFPFKRWTKFESLETAGHHQLVDPAQLREAYLANLEKFRAELKKACHRNRIDLVPVVTDQPYAESLANYLAIRSRRA